LETDKTYIDTRKLFNFSLIGIGLIFLLDFNINTVDILPDIIGLVFISAGIGKIYYISEDFSKAKKNINIFSAVASIKLIWNILYIVLELKRLDSSWILLFASLFSGFEFILSMIILTDIFKGFESFFQLGDRMAHAKKSDYILKMLKTFFILKFILALFVQIPVLITDTTWDNLSVLFDAYLNASVAQNLLLTPCFILQTLIGLFILSFFLPFFFDVGKDKNLYDFIKSKINNTLISDNFFILKQTINYSFIFFMIACVFFIDLQIDNINFLPDFFICVILLSGIYKILKTHPEMKNKRLNLYLVVNIFISVIAYITGTFYRIKAAKSFIGENVGILMFLKLSSVISFHISVIAFFLIFIEFYSFVKDFQRKHLEFSVRYLNKYLTVSEKNVDKNRNKIMIIAAAAFCVKTISTVLPQSGIVLFFHSLILVAFVFFIVKWLYGIRESVYSYYN